MLQSFLLFNYIWIRSYSEHHCFYYNVDVNFLPNCDWWWCSMVLPFYNWDLICYEQIIWIYFFVFFSILYFDLVISDLVNVYNEIDHQIDFLLNFFDIYLIKVKCEFISFLIDFDHEECRFIYSVRNNDYFHLWYILIECFICWWSCCFIYDLSRRFEWNFEIIFDFLNN